MDSATALRTRHGEFDSRRAHGPIDYWLGRHPLKVEDRDRNPVGSRDVAFLQSARRLAFQASKLGSSPRCDAKTPPPADLAPTLRTLVVEVRLLSGALRGNLAGPAIARLQLKAGAGREAVESLTGRRDAQHAGGASAQLRLISAVRWDQHPPPVRKRSAARSLVPDAAGSLERRGSGADAEGDRGGASLGV
jgi:hypothetical protein